MDLDYSALNDPISNFSRVLNANKNILFIWNLHETTTTGQLFALLSTIARVQWSQVFRRENVEFGYGYARFKDAEEVKRAQEKLPSMSAHNAGFPIHSQLSTIGACTRFVEAGKVFVDGLSEEWTEQTIRDQFQDDGAIVSVQKIAPTCAFVHFETERDAKNALEASYQKPRESALHCTLFTGYSQTKDTEKRICLRPYNLPPRMTSLELRHLFGSNMGINVVARVFEAANGESRGEGYVHFECPDKDTPLLMSFCWFNASGAMLSLSWLGEGYKHRKPHFQGNFKKFPPSATPDNKQDNLFETPPIAAPFISEIEHYEHKSKPKLLECFLGAFHVHVTHFEGSYSIPRLRQLFSQYGKVIYCEQLSEDCAIISFESLAEAMSAVGGVKARAPTLRIVIIDSYQYHHQNQLFGGRIQEDRKNPIIGNWLYQMGKGGVVKKLPSDEVAKTIDARNRELSALMHAMMDEVDPERKLALYGAYMQEKSFPISNIQMSTVGSGPSESLRGLIVAKVMELFPKSTEVQKAQMIHVMTLIPPSELVEVLIDDDGFRRKTISKTVEWKRSSL